METIKKMLAVLGLSERSQAVYLDILKNGESNARQIATRLSLPRSSIYDYLRPMLAQGLVVEKDKDGKGFFVIHDVEDLDRVVAKQAEALAFLRGRFKRDKEEIGKQVMVGIDPKIKFVEGREGVLSLLYEMLWESSEKIQTLWPYSEMLGVFTAEELEIFNRRRIRQNITLETIWTGVKPTGKHLWRGVDFKVERRQADRKYQSKMAYNIYGDKVSFISSQGEGYGFIVHSADFVNLMKMQFKALWTISK